MIIVIGSEWTKSGDLCIGFGDGHVYPLKIWFVIGGVLDVIGTLVIHWWGSGCTSWFPINSMVTGYLCLWVRGCEGQFWAGLWLDSVSFLSVGGTWPI